MVKKELSKIDKGLEKGIRKVHDSHATGYVAIFQIKKEFNKILKQICNDAGLRIKEETKNHLIFVKGEKTRGIFKLFLNALPARGNQSLILSLIKAIPWLQRQGIEVKIKEKEVKMLIVPYMELFDTREQFIFTQSGYESFFDEFYAKQLAKKIIKSLEKKGITCLKWGPNGAEFKDFFHPFKYNAKVKKRIAFD